MLSLHALARSPRQNTSTSPLNAGIIIQHQSKRKYPIKWTWDYHNPPSLNIALDTKKKENRCIINLVLLRKRK